jgi:anti-anti-sigma factor
MMEEVDVLMDDGKNNFILDLSKIDYMSSAGLNVMISLLTQSRNRYGELVVCEVPDKVSRLLVTSKLQNIFTITDTQAEALKKVKK